jgi:hypothetical protein
VTACARASGRRASRSGLLTLAPLLHRRVCLQPMDDSGVEFDSDDLYNELLSPQYATRWPKRVKLSKLVEVLVDVWESDGT